jgi:hypothetical protein
MLSESIATLQRHKHYYDGYVKSQELVNFWPHVVQELLDVYRAEYDQWYHLNKRCNACKIEFLLLIYKLYEKETN